MNVHIGSLIQARAKALRIGPTELGIKIETSKQNVYGIFKRESIDTELLMRISTALDYDFFMHMSRQMQAKLQEDAPEAIHRPSEGMQLEDVMRENQYLRRLNTLLEEKIRIYENG